MNTFDPVPLVEAMGKTAFTACDLARAADITHRMVADTACGVILCLAGSLVSAGLKNVFADAVRCNMVGGGAPKNFAQDVVVAADVMGHEVPMHKYAVPDRSPTCVTGRCPGSTLKEASSWGKVGLAFG